LVGTDRSERYAKVLKVGKSLQIVCQKLYKNSKALSWDEKKECKMKLREEIAEGV